MQVRRDPEAIPAASIGANKAETGRRTNIASGTGIGGRSLAHAHDEPRDKRHYSDLNRLFRDELMLIGLWLW